MAGHTSWREVKARKVKDTLATKVSGFFAPNGSIESLEQFHLAGQHDQETHGNWAGDLLGDIPEDAHDEVRAILKNRRIVEPDTTSTLSSVAESLGGQMLGLKYRFKDASGVVEKINRKVRDKGISHEKAAEGIADSLRYTMELDGEDYVEGIVKSVKALEDKGYKFLEVENNWKKGDAYNGVNAVFLHPETGLKVELQWHTAESWETKDKVLHKDYEFIREMKGTSAQRLLAFERMRKASDSLEFPENVDSLCERIGSVCKDVYRPNLETLSVVEDPVWRGRFLELHLQGKHNQKTHGNWSLEGDVEPYIGETLDHYRARVSSQKEFPEQEYQSWVKRKGLETRGRGRGPKLRQQFLEETNGGTLKAPKVFEFGGVKPVRTSSKELSEKSMKRLGELTSEQIQSIERYAGVEGSEKHYQKLNKALREAKGNISRIKNSELREWAETLNSAVAGTEVLSDPVKVYRGKSIIDDEFLNSQRDIKGEGLRGPGGGITKEGSARRLERVVERLTDELTGVSIDKPRAVSSTTINPMVAAGFAITERRQPTKKEGAAETHTSSENFRNYGGFIEEIEMSQGLHIAPALEGKFTTQRRPGNPDQKIPLSPQDEVILPVGTQFEVIGIEKNVPFTVRKPGKGGGTEERLFTVVKKRQILPDGTSVIEGQRVVRTPEGAAFYGQPIGSVIKAEDVKYG